MEIVASDVRFPTEGTQEVETTWFSHSETTLQFVEAACRRLGAPRLRLAAWKKTPEALSLRGGRGALEDATVLGLV